MIDPIYRIGQVDRSASATSNGGDASQPARASKFASLMYAMLKPPTLDFSDASGDDDDAPRPPMKAYVQPNLAKLMGLDTGPQGQVPVAQSNAADGKSTA